MSTSVQAGAYAEGYADGRDAYGKKLERAMDQLVQKNAEITKLQADLSEAKEIMQSMMISMRPTDGAWINLEVHKSDLKKARSFLDRTGK